MIDNTCEYDILYFINGKKKVIVRDTTQAGVLFTNLVLCFDKQSTAKSSELI